MLKEKQRVISRTEPELGLGVIKSIQSNEIKIFFPRTEDTRSYSHRTDSPIRRYILKPGDTAFLSNGTSFIIENVIEQDGLVKYSSTQYEAQESELSDQTKDLGAADLFFSGQFSSHKAFDLRKDAWAIRGEARSSGMMGLVGPRVSPMPHQLYIAKTVLAQEQPRVLLSDEVGLGKTIEAGLIFSALKTLGRADRVLILVPESLTHQWLAEMYRRFNELFTVLDLERCQEEELSQDQSVFSITNKIICSSELLIENPSYMKQALGDDWDLVIVDEAHHLKLPTNPEEITNWSLVKALSEKTHGLLLLTATPRMKGIESQFHLLNLVDPERFNDFAKFQQQSDQMKILADIAQVIISDQFTDLHISALEKMFSNDQHLMKLIHQKPVSKDPLLRALVDRHGTGRVFFRNRRKRLKGFPKRILNSVELDGEKGSRLKWLDSFCSSLEDEKALVICSSKEQVLEIDKWFKRNSEHKIALFHEDLSIVERDIQAADFAQNKKHRILVCSEIGGEGRNFQFCHNLVLFDLPMHPDLIEQRIGRLDRIGQKQDIQIHTLWKTKSAEEVYFKWYHEGLDCFEKSWNGTALLHEKFSTTLADLSREFDDQSSSTLDQSLKALINKTQEEAIALRKEQAEGIDVLMDINSFNEEQGHQFVEDIEDRDDDPRLELFIKSLFDYFGIEYTEYDDRGTLLVKGGSLSFIEHFPGIHSEEDTVIAFDRSVALEREDINFITQDHQIADESLSLLLDRNEGVASICKWLESPFENGALVEFSVLLQASGPRQLELDKYLALETRSFVINHKGQFIENSPHLNKPDLLTELSPNEDIGDTNRLSTFITPLLERMNTQLSKWASPIISKAIERSHSELEKEEQRLNYLLSVNPNMKPSEIEDFKKKRTEIKRHLQTAQPRIDAIRVIFTEPKSF